MNAVAPLLAVRAAERVAGQMAELVHPVGVTADQLLLADCAAETQHHAPLMLNLNLTAKASLLAACAFETHHQATLQQTVGKTAGPSLLAACALETHLGFAAAQTGELMMAPDVCCSG